MHAELLDDKGKDSHRDPFNVEPGKPLHFSTGKNRDIGKSTKTRQSPPSPLGKLPGSTPADQVTPLMNIATDQMRKRKEQKEKEMSDTEFPAIFCEDGDCTLG